MKHNSALSKTILFAFFLAISGQTSAQTTPVPDPLPDVSSDEFLEQYGLRTTNVYPAWSATTGSGIVVATLDTGVNVNHVEFAGRIAPGGSVQDVDSVLKGHGTAVAGIIAANFNNQGIIGVAYNASILPIQVANSNVFASASAIAAGFNQATARSDVRIITLTPAVVFSEPANSAIINAANAGKVVVINSGNGSQPNPELPPSVYNNFNGGGIIVGNVGPDGVIFQTSNRAGAAANVYMVAPGVEIEGPGNTSNTSIVPFTGTSVAAPQVAGAAALLLSQNPGLTNQQVVEILFNSATDLGAPGVDPIYGHGLLNIGAAVVAQGEIDSSSSSSSGSGVAIALGAIAIGGGVAYFWNENKKAKKALEKTLVFDSYDRPYTMNLSGNLSAKNTSPTLFNVMNMFDRQTRTVDLDVSDNLSLSVHARTINPSNYIFLKDSDPFLEEYDDVNNKDVSMKLAGKLSRNVSFNYQHNYAPSMGFDRVGSSSLSENFIWSSSYTGSYMGFGASSDNVSLGFKAGKKLSFQVGANRLNDNEVNGLASNAVIMRGSYKPTEKMSVSLSINNLFEDGSLLGGASSGAFSVDNANTTSVGLTGQYKIFDKFSLFTSYTEGFTAVKQQQGSFLQGFSSLRSHSWGTGVIGSNLFRYKDKAGFAISSPLRVSYGNVDLLIPQSLDEQRNVVNSQSRVSLAPEGGEIDFEAFYRMNLNRRTQLGTTMTYRNVPEDSNYIGAGLSVFTSVGMSF